MGVGPPEPAALGVLGGGARTGEELGAVFVGEADLALEHEPAGVFEGVAMQHRRRREAGWDVVVDGAKVGAGVGAGAVVYWGDWAGQRLLAG